MKGIILAGGSGTRLSPMTKYITKHLLPIYNKPMILYPLNTLIKSGIKDILLITTQYDKQFYELLLGNGEEYNVNISYAIQDKPNGIAEAFIIGKDFIGNDNVCLILGDNVFYGDIDIFHVNKIYLSKVKDPQRYGVAVFEDNRIIGIEEKPKDPKSNYAVTGLYVYDNSVVEKALNLKPSKRGELEITDINNIYIKERSMKYDKLDNVVWLDTGTYDSLLEASNFMQAVEKRVGK